MPQTEPMSAKKNMIRVAQCPICHANVYCCIVKVFTDPIYECLRESEEKNVSEYRDAGYEIKDIEHATTGACDCYTPNGVKKLIAQRDRDILTKAAERAVAHAEGHCYAEMFESEKEELRNAILAPINEKEEGEKESPSTFAPHEHDGQTA